MAHDTRAAQASMAPRVAPGSAELSENEVAAELRLVAVTAACWLPAADRCGATVTCAVSSMAAWRRDRWSGSHQPPVRWHAAPAQSVQPCGAKTAACFQRHTRPLSSLCTKYISTRGCEMGKRARTAGRNSEIQAEHSGGEMGYQGANIWAIQANEGWC